MKYDRIQEMFRYITPGLFLMALILLIHFEELIEDKTLLEAVKGFETIIIVLMPFVGFVVGYLIECMMTWVERGLYYVRISRPSRKVLSGKSELYILDDEYADAILDGTFVNDNKTANKYQQIAKQEVGDNDLVNRYYYQSIMARHILGAQLIASIYWLGFAGGWSLWHLVYAVFFIVVLVFFWYHQNCIYMKYLFAEYAKIILSHQKKTSIDE